MQRQRKPGRIPDIEQNRSIEEELVQSLTLSRTPEKTTSETDADPAMPYVIGLYVLKFELTKTPKQMRLVKNPSIATGEMRG